MITRTHVSRIPMPFTLSEYRIGQLYATVQESRANTDGSSAIQVLCNEPFSTHDAAGQHTHKRIHFGNKLPRFLDFCLPDSYKVVDELSWNSFPNCKTEYRHDRFPNCRMVVKSVHVESQYDDGGDDNVFGLSSEDLQRRQVIELDLGSADNGAPSHKDPRTCTKGLGPLKKGWWKDSRSHAGRKIMCAYKLLDFRFDSYLLKAISGQFVKYVYCLYDEWYELKMEDIRRLEAEYKEEADQMHHVIASDIKKVPWTIPATTTMLQAGSDRAERQAPAVVSNDDQSEEDGEVRTEVMFKQAFISTLALLSVMILIGGGYLIWQNEAEELKVFGKVDMPHQSPSNRDEQIKMDHVALHDKVRSLAKEQQKAQSLPGRTKQFFQEKKVNIVVITALSLTLIGAFVGGLFYYQQHLRTDSSLAHTEEINDLTKQVSNMQEILTADKGTLEGTAANSSMFLTVMIVGIVLLVVVIVAIIVALKG